ncbi:hypothetical protein DFH29DRAFT_871813 [Suillus ampliporus]|nr:hypothetical protein DFH29DRAFT_871813 [Suillus ampliporus]
MGILNQATANFFANITDPKAQIITTYNNIFGVAAVSELVFYDGPSPPAGIFDEFLVIPYLLKDISTRGIFNTISVLDHPVSLIESIVNESVFWGQSLDQCGAWFISYDITPLLLSIFDHSTTPSAYPPSRDQGLLPLNIYSAWTDLTWDGIVQQALFWQTVSEDYSRCFGHSS